MSYFAVGPDDQITLPPLGALGKTQHVFDETSLHALDAALAANRPLLVRGEPGTGKSQLARAAAAGLKVKRALVTAVIDARTEAQDLLWSFDAVARLAEAQVLATTAKVKSEDSDEDKTDRGADHVRRELRQERFLIPAPLWWAFHWDDAEAQLAKADAVTPERPLMWKPDDWQPEHGTVLLIDEIDKADSAVPNGLLECLGAGHFQAPGGCKVSRREGTARPLVILTTNEERALPDAFLRRCLVLQLSWPDEDKQKDRFLVELKKRGRAHFRDLSDDILHEAAEQLAEDRKAVRRRGLFPPGGAEYLDLLRALVELTEEVPEAEREAQQHEWLGRIRDFALKKHPEESPW